MQIAQLEAFLRVASTGSFSEAARQLGITQPSVSARIAALESSLDARLLHRRGSNTALTAVGERFFAVADEIVRLTAQAKAVIGNAREEGAVTLGANASSAAALVPRLVTAFRREYSWISLDVLVDSTRGLMAPLRSGELDLAFVNPVLADQGVGSNWSYSRETVLACSPSHPMAGTNLADFRRLVPVPFVAYTVGPAQAALDQLARVVGETFRVAVTSNSTDVAVAAVKSGAGMGFLPKDVIASSLQSGDLGRVLLHGLVPPDWEVHLVQWRSRTLSPDALLFANFISRQAKSLLL